MRGRLAIVLLAMVVALAFGCARILGFGDVPAPADAGDDASEGPDASQDAGADASDGNACALVRAPGPPSSDDPSDAGDQAFIVALHTLDLGLRVDGGPSPLLGYDVDGVDTCCQGAPESCRAAVSGSTHCDEDGGRDDQAEQLMLSISQVTSTKVIDQDVINQRIASGKESMLLQIEHYNGQPNDTAVTVAVYGSYGTAPAADGGAAVPQWDGTDAWTLDSAFVAAGGMDAGPIIPNQFDTHAYVSNGVLVAGVDIPLPFQLGGSYLQLTGATIVARLAPSLGSFRVADGQLSGRWAASSIFAWVQTVKNPLGPGYVCKGSSLYQSFKGLVCKALDVVSDPTQDRTGATCDALSMGLGFTAEPALAGPVISAGAPPGCPDGGPDDCTTTMP
jgi:hypothetical protein